MNPMRILVCVVLIWTFLEMIYRFCATLSAVGTSIFLVQQQEAYRHHIIAQTIFTKTNIVAEYAKMSSQKIYKLWFFWQTFEIIPKFFNGISLIFWKRASLILFSPTLSMKFICSNIYTYSDAHPHNLTGSQKQGWDGCENGLWVSVSCSCKSISFWASSLTCARALSPVYRLDSLIQIMCYTSVNRWYLVLTLIYFAPSLCCFLLPFCLSLHPSLSCSLCPTLFLVLLLLQARVHFNHHVFVLVWGCACVHARARVCTCIRIAHMRYEVK